MRFLIDAQLPPALARFLSSRGHVAEHVQDIGMTGAEDHALWNYAVQVSATILTKDEDFVIRSTLDASGPPIVWIRIGNTSKHALIHWIETSLPDIEQALLKNEKVIEII